MTDRDLHERLARLEAIQARLERNAADLALRTGELLQHAERIAALRTEGRR